MRCFSRRTWFPQRRPKELQKQYSLLSWWIYWLSGRVLYSICQLQCGWFRYHITFDTSSQSFYFKMSYFLTHFTFGCWDYLNKYSKLIDKLVIFLKSYSVTFDILRDLQSSEATGRAWLIWTQLIWSFLEIFARFLSFHV